MGALSLLGSCCLKQTAEMRRPWFQIRDWHLAFLGDLYHCHFIAEHVIFCQRQCPCEALALGGLQYAQMQIRAHALGRKWPSTLIDCSSFLTLHDHCELCTAGTLWSDHR